MGDGVIQKDYILFGKYRILSIIGHGSFGEIYKVCQTNLNSIRALKCIHKSNASYDDILREVDILKNLRHPGIPIIYDIEEDEERVCIIEEYIEGMSLDSQLNTRIINANEALSIVDKLCDVLEYLHGAGIFHQDIKPENIIWHNNNVKLIDYGSAGKLGERYSYFTGTRGYAAPETYGRAALDETADIYSVGVLLLTLITGSRRIENLDGLYPSELGRMIDRCVSHSSRVRYNSIAKLRVDIRRLKDKKNVSKISRKIAVVGAYNHCGATHSAWILARILQRKKYRVLLQEKNDSKEFFFYIKDAHKVKFKGGIYNVDGLDIMPFYDGCMQEANLNDEYDWIICDYGVPDKEHLLEIVMADRICLVSGTKSYEIEKAVELKNALLSDMNVKWKMYTLCVFSSMNDFKRAVWDRRIIHPIRVAYETRPEKYSIKGIEKCFEENKEPK